MVKTPNHQPIPENPETIDPAAAALTADSLRILNDPAVDTLLAIDRAENPLGQTRQYIQQAIVGHMFVQGVVGNYGDMRSRELLDKAAADSSLTMTLRSSNEFHSGLVAYSRAQNKSTAELAADITSGNTLETITLAARDVIGLYHKGLVKPDGNSDNLQYAGRVLRFLNTSLLFSPIEEPGLVGQFYDDLYTAAVGERPAVGRRNDAARGYAEAYSKPVTRGSEIQKRRTRLGNHPEEVTNRAALQLLIGNAKGNLQAVQDINSTRELYAGALTAIGECPDIVGLNDRIVDLVKRLGASAKTEAEQIDLSESVIQATQLDWEVLPPGDLEKIARDIVDGLPRSSKPPTIDLERLKILDNIRTSWGADASYYVRGNLGKRRVIKAGANEEPDQYLLLILQDLAPGGKVVQEHAVAESPIAGPHALYVFREDVSAGLHWREVMALPKSYARALSARAVKHQVPRGAPQDYLIPSMTEKVTTLLSCKPEEFGILEFNGERGFRIPKQALPQVETEQS